MTNVKIPKKNPVCGECGSTVKITIPIDKIGNAYDEKWDCPNCGEDIQFITVDNKPL